MRKMFIPALAVTIMAAATGGVFAADTSGTIKSMDTAAHTITLEDGKVYHLAPGTDMSHFKQGEKVQVTFDAKNGMNNASSVKAASK